jgi:hypothetical protein
MNCMCRRYSCPVCLRQERDEARAERDDLTVEVERLLKTLHDLREIADNAVVAALSREDVKP